MERKFLQDISANTLQMVINQAGGLCIFYILSRYLDKSAFGEINWSLAVLMTVFGILSCGIDQVFVKRIAMGAEKKTFLSIYLSHVSLTGGLFYAVMLSGSLLFPSFFSIHHLLLMLGIGKLMIFFSTPFKQLATGMEQFRALLWMSVCSNLVRSIALIALAVYGHVGLEAVILIFIAGDLAEVLLSMFITFKFMKVPVSWHWNGSTYQALLAESLPQLGVSIFASILARFDWIFLGLFSTTIILAEYSFAYKVFEMSSLPLLVIAPVLIPRFTRLFHSPGKEVDPSKLQSLHDLLRLELVIASLTGLVLNMLWVPLVDQVTQGKYGAVNSHTILLLTSCLPLLYLNNFLWTVNFAGGRLKMILGVFAITVAVNIMADLLLIPHYGGEGAAAGYLLAMATQSAVYLAVTALPGIRRSIPFLLIIPACAFAAGAGVLQLTQQHWPAFFLSLIAYALLLFLSGRLRKDDRLVFKRISAI